MPRGGQIRLVGLAGAVAVLSVALVACGGSGGSPAPAASGAVKLSVTSSLFQDGEAIPAAYSCDGDAGSIDLQWSGAPSGTKSYVVLALDPDAGNFVHWLIYGIPPSTIGEPPGISNEPQLADASRQGKNSFGDIGYGPPCPPKGSTHKYHFHVYALDTQLTADSGAGEGEITKAMDAHILADGEVIGRFGR